LLISGCRYLLAEPGQYRAYYVNLMRPTARRRARRWSFVALRQAENEFVRAGEPGGRYHPLDVHARVTERDVSRAVRLNTTFSRNTTPICRRSQAGSASAR